MFASADTMNQRLAAFVDNSRGVELPKDVVQEAKRSLLNVLGASAGASSHPAIRILRATATPPRPGTPIARVLWTHDQFVPETAAFVNAAMMHVLDFDDTYRSTYCHPGAPVAAAALAVADAFGATGMEFLTALVVGIEVQLAVSEALFPSHYLRGFHITATTAGVGAAAASAVLLRAERDVIVHALGLAMTSSAGLIESLGTMGNAYHVGSATRIGVEAARLAAGGYQSVATLFEGDKGMLRAMSNEPPERATAVFESLGRVWRILQTSYKRFPTETITQAPLEAILNVRRRLAPKQRATLTAIVLLAKPIVAEVVEQRRRKFGPRPRSELEAKFDIRYCMAAAWVAGEWTSAQLAPEAIADSRIGAVRDVITVLAHPDWTGNQVKCEFSFSDGTKVVEYVEAFVGSADNPMTDADLEAKLAESADPGWRQSSRYGETVAAVWRLNELTTISSLIGLMSESNTVPEGST